MEELLLCQPDASLVSEIRAFRQELLDCGSSADGCAGLQIYDNPMDWLRHCAEFADQETVPQGRVPASQYVYLRKTDGKIVGMLQIRHWLNDYLAKYSGHIGYAVRPSERRKGYAKRMLHDALPECRALGLERVMVSCTVENEASRRTILANGGVYDGAAYEPGEGITLERYWIAL